MRIRYQQEPEDWEVYGEYALGHLEAVRSEVRRAQRQAAVVAAVAFGSLIYLTRSAIIAVFGLATVGWIVVGVPRQARVAMRRQMRQLYSASTNPCLRGLHELEATDEGLKNACDAGSGLTRWAGIAAVDQTASHAILVFGNGGGIAVPRARVTEGDMDAFVAVVRMHVASPGA